jgi:GGDEF domain-containing protein
MPTGMIRALQVRTADRLRASLVVDSLSGLPSIDALSEADQRELCDVGGGRLAAVAIQVSWRAVEETRVLQLQALMVREVARLIDDHVRRTDLLGILGTDTLLVLAPGLDPLSGRSLADRLRTFLADRIVEAGGTAVELLVKVGAAFRSAASPPGWTTRALAAEAEIHLSGAPPIESVA